MRKHVVLYSCSPRPWRPSSCEGMYGKRQFDSSESYTRYRWGGKISIPCDKNRSVSNHILCRKYALSHLVCISNDIVRIFYPTCHLLLLVSSNSSKVCAYTMLESVKNQTSLPIVIASCFLVSQVGGVGCNACHVIIFRMLWSAENPETTARMTTNGIDWMDSMSASLKRSQESKGNFFLGGGVFGVSLSCFLVP
jgi:hypothetical protein